MPQLRKISDSFFELKNAYALCCVAMLLALRVALGFFANVTLPFFGSSAKLSAAFLPIAVTGALFGPLPAAAVGALGDVLSFAVAPGGTYFPGFTLSGFITGFIYGMALYKRRVTLPRVIAAWTVNTLLVETFLAAFWLYTLYGGGKTYFIYLSARFIGSAAKCLPEILLTLWLGKLACKVKFPHGLKNRR